MICFAAQTDKADKAGPGMQQKTEQKTEYYCNVEKILFWKYTNLNKSLNVQLQAVTYSLKLLRLKLICSRHGEGPTVKLNI